MEIKVGASKDETSTHTPPSSSNSLFRDQPLHAGILSNYERSTNEIMGVTEAMIEREAEKRRIRDEMLTAWLRRRELEEEVIREMMLEREIAMRRGDMSLLGSELRGGPLLNSRDGFANRLAVMGSQEAGIDRRLSLVNRVEGGFDGRLSLGNRSEGGFDGRLSLVNRMEGGVDGRLPLVNRAERWTSGGFPFQRQPGASNEAGVKPLIDLRKGKDISSVKPVNSSASGIKRKFETPIKEGDETASASKTKKSNKEWICALCQVKATSEQGLKDHLKGKKHTAKEKASQRTTKSMSNNLDNSDSLPEVTEKSIQLAVSTGTVSSNLGNNVNKIVEAEDLRKINGGPPVDEKQKKMELKNCNTKFKFWCTLCNVGATSEAQMTTHRIGKKHMTLLQENGGGVIAINTMLDDVKYVDATLKAAANDGKEVSPGNGDGQADGFGADQEENVDGGELVTVGGN